LEAMKLLSKNAKKLKRMIKVSVRRVYIILPDIQDEIDQELIKKKPTFIEKNARQKNNELKS